MKKITENIIKEYILKNEIEFNSSHNKLSLPVINRIYKKMINGIKFDDIKVCDKIIIDGHHRYISSLLANFEINKVKSNKSSATVECNWNDVDFTNEEWDTEVKIQYLNKIDAKFNNISIEKIIEITK